MDVCSGGAGREKTREYERLEAFWRGGGFWLCGGVVRGWRALLREDLGARGMFGGGIGAFPVVLGWMRGFGGEFWVRGYSCWPRGAGMMVIFYLFVAVPPRGRRSGLKTTGLYWLGDGLQALPALPGLVPALPGLVPALPVCVCTVRSLISLQLVASASRYS